MPRDQYYSEGYRDGYKDALESVNELQYLSKIGLTGKRASKIKKRKPSAYSKRYSTAYKRLKKKHPRMSFGSLSKKAHREARR